MEIQQQRNTAHKVWIASLLKAQYTKGLGEFESGFVEIKDNKVSRVNLVGSIIDRFEGNNYLSVNLDDGSGIISLRSWSADAVLFANIEIGDLVLIVGKLKEYNGKVYVAPEFVKKLENPLWLKVRKLELLKEFGEVERVENAQTFEKQNYSKEEETSMNVVEEKMGSSSGNSREVLLSLIENFDNGMGADIDLVLEKSGLGENGRKLIVDLIKEGEVFELQVGKLRVMG